MAAVAIAAQLVTACVVPGHMHVTQGVTPQNVDTNVRFRTTYYFRVFDYCWSADAAISNGVSYRKIVPESDTLYRYRMTGKASALGNQIKFESGMLPKEEIDPFGADVTYNGDINGFVYRSREDAKHAADEAAAAHRSASKSAAALERFRTLEAMLAALRRDADTETRTALANGMKEALQAYLGALSPAANDQLAQKIDALQASVTALQAKAAPAATANDELAAISARLSALETARAAAELCSVGEIQKRGFQIMGPQGMRPFDQDSRLIMAMHSSAKPLIETLSEYSNRLLKPRMNPAEQLLPLARETTVIVQTQRALDRVTLKLVQDGDAKPKVDDVFEAAAVAFDPEVQ
ncbi:MAG: hypothetical protein JWQ29_2108 [Phenylobacterium sp.]|nr:hypothetical protein [Phenylobacterium sp.]